ncbi:hypothetical protein E3N88_22274 [Mikania micrantha]|uniref:60S ribosomal protein L17 n=1 Tax=Mikania micrantha TaxID=192012 RepID=A0A5N6NBH3_9ASTR|nr:hypothetical protein E3N88_22274 [Mikania micrantha]
MPINGRSLWEKTHIPTTLAPPKHHNQVGMPKRARNKSANETKERAESGRLSKKNTKGACSKSKKRHSNGQGCWPAKSAKFILDLLKNVERNEEVKGLDVDALHISHIQVNQAQKQRLRTYRAHGRINLMGLNVYHTTRSSIFGYLITWFPRFELVDPTSCAHKVFNVRCLTNMKFSDGGFDEMEKTRKSQKMKSLVVKGLLMK